jgi:hypothetical protein
MDFSENEKAHTRPFFSCMGFSMSRFRAGGLLYNTVALTKSRTQNTELYNERSERGRKAQATAGGGYVTACGFMSRTTRPTAVSSVVTQLKHFPHF